MIGYRATRSATATRTDTPLRDTPQSVQVVPREVLVDQQDIRLSDALQNVSSVQPGGTIQGRSDTFIIRGFRTQTYAIDGVLLNQAGTFATVTRDLADVERIEVLKGPASVLYGRGEPGGLINIVTRQPTLVPSGDINLQAGSFGFRRVQGSVSSAIEGVDGLAARVSFAGQSDPTFRNFGGRDNSRTFVAPAFTWNPGPDTRVTFLGEFTRVDNQYDEGLVARNGGVPLDNIARYYGAPFSRYNGEANFGLLKVEHDLNENITLREVLNAQWGGFNFIATRATGLANPNTQVTRRETAGTSTYASVDSQTEVVAKFDLLGFRHTVLTGIEYSNGMRHSYTTQSTNYPSVSFLNPVPDSTIVGLQFQADLKQKNALTGLYVQDQIDLGLGLQLLVGVRYDTGTQYYFNRVPTSRTIPPDQQLSGTSPRVGLVYRPVEPLTLYASYATSFKPQTDNVLNAVNPPPETGELYEIGSRLDLTPDLTLSAAGFRIIRNNVAATDPGQHRLLGDHRAAALGGRRGRPRRPDPAGLESDRRDQLPRRADHEGHDLRGRQPAGGGAGLQHQPLVDLRVPRGLPARLERRGRVHLCRAAYGRSEQQLLGGRLCPARRGRVLRLQRARPVLDQPAQPNRPALHRAALQSVQQPARRAALGAGDDHGTAVIRPSSVRSCLAAVVLAALTLTASAAEEDRTVLIVVKPDNPRVRPTG